MLIDKNSLLSYYNGVYTKRFSKKRFLIYAYIASNPKITRQDLADSKELGLPINEICGRVKELIDKRLICEIKEQPRNRLIVVKDS